MRLRPRDGPPLPGFPSSCGGIPFLRLVRSTEFQRRRPCISTVPGTVPGKNRKASRLRPWFSQNGIKCGSNRVQTYLFPILAAQYRKLDLPPFRTRVTKTTILEEYSLDKSGKLRKTLRESSSKTEAALSDSRTVAASKEESRDHYCWI